MNKTCPLKHVPDRALKSDRNLSLEAVAELVRCTEDHCQWWMTFRDSASGKEALMCAIEAIALKGSATGLLVVKRILL